MARKLMKGCEAIAEAAVQAGCKLFFGYPITPQNELPEYLSVRLPQVGGRFVQAESEIAASNMIYGAAGTGERVMTSSSSPGISLMAEAISYCAGAQLPVVVVNIMRAGPGLGGILPSQSDYLQATRGAGHGDYHMLVLAPGSVQEAVDLMRDAFDLADFYRNPVMVLGDGVIGQIMEAVDFKPERAPCRPQAPKTWATTGSHDDRPRNVINSLFLDPEVLERHNLALKKKYEAMARDEVRFEGYGTDQDYELLLVAYGTVARVCKTAVQQLRSRGIKAALFRPITLYPFPYEALAAAARKARRVLVAELSTGQMIDDVKQSVQRSVPVGFVGRCGGMLITPEEVAAAAVAASSPGREVAHG